MNPRSLLRLVFVLPVVATAMSCPPKPADAPDLTRVVALGRLEPATGLLIVGAPPGDRVESLDAEFAKEYRAAGEEMGRLASWTDRNRELQMARARLKEGRERKELIEKQADAQVAEAQERLKLLTAQQGPDLEAQQELINTINSRKTQAEKTLNDFIGSGLSRQVVEPQRNVLSQLDIELATANLKMKQAKAAYAMNIALADKALDVARTTRDRMLAELPEQSLEESVKAAEERLRHALILSPGPGRILQVLTHQGETVSARPILRFGDPSRMIVAAEVYETDVNRLRKDDPADVEFLDVPPGGAAVGQVRLKGKVTRIGQLVNVGSALDLNPAANADRRVIDVRIELDDESSARAAKFVNRQVRVIIETGKR